MATILRHGGFTVRIWSNDHLPRHVHLFKGDGTCVINLKGKNGLPELREFYNLKRSEVGQALKIVCQYQHELMEAWSRIHGEY